MERQRTSTQPSFSPGCVDEGEEGMQEDDDDEEEDEEEEGDVSSFLRMASMCARAA